MCAIAGAVAAVGLQVATEYSKYRDAKLAKEVQDAYRGATIRLTDRFAGDALKSGQAALVDQADQDAEATGAEMMATRIAGISARSTASVGSAEGGVKGGSAADLLSGFDMMEQDRLATIETNAKNRSKQRALEGQGLDANYLERKAAARGISSGVGPNKTGAALNGLSILLGGYNDIAAASTAGANRAQAQG